MGGRLLRVAMIVALALGALGAVQGAQARSAVTLSLDVTFDYNGGIAVALPNGNAVGTTSGAPTVIPAGYYTISLSGPGGCTWSPYFELKGPGVSIVDNLDEGQDWSASFLADFLPNTTYTWWNDSNPSQVYSFTTSGTVVGTAPTPIAVHQAVYASHGSANSDLVGSSVIPFRGALTGSLRHGGTPTLVYQGKAVSRLSVGQYTLRVAATQATKLMLVSPAHQTTILSASSGSVSLDLTAGTWLLRSGAGTTSVPLHVG